MYLLVTDETNRTATENIKFFVYGGLVIPFDKISELDSSIRQIRVAAGYQDIDEFKFETRSRPNHVTITDATEAKKATVNICKELGCKFIAHVIHHSIIQNQDQSEQIHKAADYVIGRFHIYLIARNSDGICLMDNLPDRTELAYMTRKFQSGLTLQNNEIVPLNRIKLFGSTCVGASHANSAMDIVLGSFRYCINQPQNLQAAQEMLGSVVKLMWSGQNRDGTITVGDKGLILRPQLNRINSRSIRAEYDELLVRLNGLLN